MLPCDVEDTDEPLFHYMRILKVKEGINLNGAEYQVASGYVYGKSHSQARTQTELDTDMVNSYWKMSHAFSALAPAQFERWLPSIEDDNISFVAFTKRFWDNNSNTKDEE